MVSFSQTDFKIILSMVVFVVVISFLFPPMGFTAESVNSTDIPNFNASQNTFTTLGEAPELPSGGSEGQLEYIEGAQSHEDNRNIWIQEDEIGLSMFNTQTPSDPLMRVQLTNHTNSESLQDWEYINESEYVVFQNWSYEVSVENLEFSDGNQTATADWEIHERPEDTSFLGSIPFIGGLAEIAGVLVWIGQTIVHFIITVFTAIANLGIAIVNIITFIFSFLFWLLSTYGTVTASAPTGWASAIMAIPGIILSFEFAKLAILVINTASGLIPTT